MSELDEISRVIGRLEANISTLTTAVETLNTTVMGLQKTRWTTKGLIAGLSLGGGAIGSKLLEILTGSPPPPNFPQ